MHKIEGINIMYSHVVKCQFLPVFDLVLSESTNI